MKKISYLSTVSLMFTLIVLFGRTDKVQAEECYVMIDKSANLNPKIVTASAVSLLSRYVEKVEFAPPGGFGIKECTYRVSLSESREGFFLTLSGRKINSIGESKLQGVKGFNQALLRSILRSIDDDKTKKRFCRDNRQLLDNECKPVEAIVFLFDDQGKMIPTGSTVREHDRFNVMVQPVSTLYAYIIARDSSNNLTRIFPNPAVSDHSNPLQAGRQYFFPPRNSDLIFAFDKNPGEEKLYFLLSAFPMPDVNSFFQKFDRMESDLERFAAVPAFEKKIAYRGFKLKKTDKKIRLYGIDSKTKKEAIAELLQGSGILTISVTLQHLP